MIKGVGVAECDSAKYFIHSLQRAIEESLITTKAKIHSPRTKLAESPTSTRRYHTLEFYLLFNAAITRTQRAVSLYIRDHESLNNLIQSQWELIKQCIKLLKPFEEITKITSSSVSCTSEVISHVVTLLKYLEKEETADRTPNLLTMRSTLNVELEKRFDLDDNDKYLVTTFLDPRFKTNFLGLVQTETARLKIFLETLKICCNKSSSTDDDSSPPSKKRNTNKNDRTIEIHDSFWNCFEKIATGAGNMQNEVMETSAIANEIDFYLKTVCLDRTADPYKWWSANAKHLITKLGKMRFEGTSTVRDNRTEQCPLEDRKAFGKKARGWYDFALDEENNVIVVRWNDNSVVTVMSNKCGVAATGTKLILYNPI
ncbi:hypothetical protein ILUMI_13819 [Ignelater luminosus]|uniref:Uncharacterized protein n=1 Tax=Ignelater luminosus TaxID=2038154 RepID=A0A8K0CX28_IGNLU|nr:hypothetical protein ILUMI_13819 [Ignelater luminosus]